MTTYKDLVSRLGEQTAAKVLVTFGVLQAGEIAREQAVAVIATLIAKANQRAAVLADLGLAASLSVATRAPVTPQGLRRPTDDLRRLQEAAETLLAIEDVTEERVARLGRSEPLDAAQQARGDGMAKSKLVEGWTRSLSASACQLCRWWWRDGRVWPKDVPIQRHKGCTCVQTPVLVEDVAPAPYAGTHRRRLSA